jgi:hypothetical protein
MEEAWTIRLNRAQIPQTAVWGSFKFFLRVKPEKRSSNPPNGSLGIVQVLSTSKARETFFESPKRQFGDTSSPTYSLDPLPTSATFYRIDPGTQK